MSTENPSRPPIEALEARLAAIDEHKHDPLGGVGDCKHCDAMDVYELALRNAAPDLFAYICSLETRLAQPLPDDYDVAKLVRWVEGIEFRSKTPQMIEWYPQVKLMADTLTALARRNAELERERKGIGIDNSDDDYDNSTN